MEISVEAPDDPEICRQLIFNPRFHNVDALVEQVEPGVLDYRALSEIGPRIQRTINTSPHLEKYMVAIWQALRKPAAAGLAIDGVDMGRLVQGGASPRGLSFLMRAARVHAWLAGRGMVVPEDIRAVFAEVMSHRIFIDPLYESRSEALVAELRRQIFASVPAP